MIARHANESEATVQITRVRCYRPQRPNPTFNQADMVVTVETDAGITGVGEGGSPEMLAQCAAMLIGEDPGRIQHLWQLMYRGFFYPPGREKLHALGALDLALWDIQGKRFGAPVYELLGGPTRDYVECYSTGYPWQGSLAATARACVEAGFRAFRTAVADPPSGVFDARRMVEKTAANCREVRQGVGPDGDWSIDFHTRLDLADAVRLCELIGELGPLFVEDPLRSENPGALAMLRQQTRLPIAVGEQFGDRWEINELIEHHLIDYTRVTLPNVGGITEWQKIAAICETHYLGMIPHFTGPIALAALVHVLCAQPAPALMEVVGAGPQPPPHLPQGCDFRDGKLWPSRRPGLGVEFDPAGATLVAEVDAHSAPIPLLRRPDGSYTNW
ncbi:mandelate racemase/muconate lactonizing enzyme family protein [Kouleothrix sp.]|uniref:mandelate racemase/muconate lactonizing enzyme family protein n=1 Tax=Kouleothrix sp. TaxID=2779161 RepID=UPI00391A92E2